LAIETADEHINEHYDGTSQLAVNLAELDPARAVLRKYAGASPAFGAPSPFDTPAARLSYLDGQLVAAYSRSGDPLLPVPALPHTKHFEDLYASQVQLGDTRTRGDLYFRLWQLAQAGRLPRAAARAAMPAPGEFSVNNRDLDLLAMLYVAVLSRTPRERLPYSGALLALVSEFNAKTGRRPSSWLDAPAVWYLTGNM